MLTRFVQFLFGEKLFRQVGIYQNAYMRFAFITGFFVHLPLIIIFLYLAPLEKLYSLILIKPVINMIASISFNFDSYLQESQFPEYSIVFISIVNTLGICSLVLPLIFSKPYRSSVEQIRKISLKRLVHIFTGAPFFLVVGYFGFFWASGKINLPGCENCMKTSKLFFVSIYLLYWWLIHFILNITVLTVRGLMIIKGFVKKPTSIQYEEG